MKIACVTSDKRGETDALLSEAARILQAKNKSLIGIVKVSDYASQYENGCDMKVRVLPQGPEIKITQNLGKGSNSCRLDPGAIATAVSEVEATTTSDADLFILNKFGPEELSGRGFVSAIGHSLAQGVPVIVGVGRGSISAFEAFSDGLAETLPDDLGSILDWCEEAMGPIETTG